MNHKTEVKTVGADINFEHSYIIQGYIEIHRSDLETLTCPSAEEIRTEHLPQRVLSLYQPELKTETQL